jgi:hypothetical protein
MPRFTKKEVTPGEFVQAAETVPVTGLPPVAEVPAPKPMDRGEFLDFLRGDMSQDVPPNDLLRNLRRNHIESTEEAGMVTCYLLAKILEAVKG